MITYRIKNRGGGTIIIKDSDSKTKFLKYGETYEGTVSAVEFCRGRVQMTVEPWCESKRRIFRKRT